VLAGYHPGKRRSAADEDAAEVDLKRAPPQFRVDLPGRADRAAYCGVVDQQVRRPKLPLQLGEGVRGLVLVTYVRDGGRGDASGGADVLGSRGQLICGAGYQADGCPASASASASTRPRPRPPPLMSATDPASSASLGA
jgi:hypothetical protein